LFTSTCECFQLQKRTKRETGHTTAATMSPQKENDDYTTLQPMPKPNRKCTHECLTGWLGGLACVSIVYVVATLISVIIWRVFVVYNTEQTLQNDIILANFSKLNSNTSCTIINSTVTPLQGVLYCKNSAGLTTIGCYSVKTCVWADNIWSPLAEPPPHFDVLCANAILNVNGMALNESETIIQDTLPTGFVFQCFIQRENEDQTGDIKLYWQQQAQPKLLPLFSTEMASSMCVLLGGTASILVCLLLIVTGLIIYNKWLASKNSTVAGDTQTNQL